MVNCGLPGGKMMLEDPGNGSTRRRQASETRLGKIIIMDLLKLFYVHRQLQFLLISHMIRNT